MASYVFDTITASQALAFGSADSLTFAAGASAKTTAVFYLPDGTFSLNAGGRTVIFSAYFVDNLSRVSFPDNSTLFLGSSSADSRTAGPLPSTGAMYGGDGADSLSALSGDWYFQGNQGNDVIVAWAKGANTIYGGQGDDRLSTQSGGPDPIRGQFMQGNKGRDTIQGDNGNDTLLGGQDNDLIFGTGGNDVINGNLGDDDISGSGQLFGEGGNDAIAVYTTFDSTASGGDGNDYIQIGSGELARIVASGDGGNDTINAFTSTRNDIKGGDGDDVIRIGRNLSIPTNYSATIDGGAGADTIEASIANDRIRGGAGADRLTGGGGADLFIQDSAAATLTLESADRITDWASDDKIQLGAAIGGAYAEATAPDFFTALSEAQGRITTGQTEVLAVQVGADVIVFADASSGATLNTITVLVGRSLNDIASDNFV